MICINMVNTHPIITGKHDPTMSGKHRPAIDMPGRQVFSLFHTDAYRVHCVYNSGTIWNQICNISMVILAQNRRNRQLFPPFPLPAHLSH